MEQQDRIDAALEIAMRYGSTDGAHHLRWVIDQMARALCGSMDHYREWVAEARDGEDGPETYGWDTGIAP